MVRTSPSPPKVWPNARAALERILRALASLVGLAHTWRTLRPLRGLPPGARVPSSVYLYSGESARDCCYRARHLELPEEISRNSRGRRPRGANQFEEGAAVHCSAGYIFLLFFSAPVVCWEPFPLGARSFVLGNNLAPAIPRKILKKKAGIRKKRTKLIKGLHGVRHCRKKLMWQCFANIRNFE